VLGSCIPIALALGALSKPIPTAFGLPLCALTLEDVIEELLGQIHNEFDVEQPELQRNPDGTYKVAGGMLVEELEDALGLELSDRDDDTIGGGVFSELGRNPVVGDRVELGPITLEVLEMRPASPQHQSRSQGSATARSRQIFRAKYSLISRCLGTDELLRATRLT
jgi:hypothetical protein